MTQESRLLALLRSGLPPMAAAGPSRDMWPLIMERSRERLEWSWLDAALAAGVALVLWMRPELLTLLAYHF